MANEKFVAHLRTSVEQWNAWRNHNLVIFPDLRKANLRKANLRKANLTRADFTGADLTRADFTGADLTGADLTGADLRGADLTGADLTRAVLDDADLTGATLHKADFHEAWLTQTILTGADLREVDLTGATLHKADFHEADLRGATFREADLHEADLHEADLRLANINSTNLRGANLKKTVIGLTNFGDIDLRTVQGLETIIHEYASTIGTDTILRSEGDIPEVFLRGAGLSDTFIEYARSLAQHPIEYYTCFISYSSEDEAFVTRLYADLQNNDVRCWFAPEDMKIGDKIRPRIDENIRLFDKLLLVLSQHSITSNWVAYEVEKALDKEPQGIPNVLFPIRIDDTILTCNTSWAQDIKHTRHIGDFSHWKDHDAYQQAFARLLRDLKAESST